MAKRAPPTLPKRLIWRISESAPLGELIDPAAPVRAPATATPATDLPEASSSGGWIVSSFELLNGIDVTESGDTVSDEVFDELFSSPIPFDKPPAKPR